MRYILPIIILCLAAAGFWYIKDNAPQAKKRPPSKVSSIKVHTQIVMPKPISLTLQSYGQVSAKTQTQLTSQVSGVITKVSENFKEGAFFAKGDVLINIDSRDYQNTINSAKASLTQAQQDLALEKAKVAQAIADWKRLNKNTKVPALVSRTPQVVSAKAKVSAMHAQYNQAIINFKRTKITAPFAGRIVNKQVNLGDFVNANTALAQIISSDALQVRLSLKNSDLAYINLPEQHIDSSQTHASSSTFPKVTFTTDLIETQHWNGQIVRTEATIDSSSQQLFVIGEIDAPFDQINSDKHPLKIGQYVTASIQGKTLPSAISVNIENLYQGQFVYVIEDSLIQQRPVTVVWRNDSIAIIGNGLKRDDQLITSLLSDGAQGSTAEVIDPKNPKRTNPKKKDKRKAEKGKESQKKNKANNT